MGLREEMNQQAQEVGKSQGGDMLQFKQSGEFQLRVMTKPVALATHFFGKGQSSAICYGMDKGCPFHDEGAPRDDKGGEKKASVKFMTYVIERDPKTGTGGEIKLAELPWSVVSRIADFEENKNWKFERYPMPYDITVTYDKENKDPKAMYKTEAIPNFVAVTTEEENALAEVMNKITPEAYVQKRKDGQIEKHKADGTWDRANAERQERLKRGASAVVEAGIEYPEANPEDIPF